MQCPVCHNEVASQTAFCNHCGAPLGAAATAPATPTYAVQPVVTTGSGLSETAAAAISYITIIPAIIFLVTEPYNKSRFVRFHSWQNLFLHLAAVVLWIGLFIVSIVLAFIPILGHLISFLIWAGLCVGFLIVWIILLMKANQGVMYKLPVIGDLAEKQANAM